MKLPDDIKQAITEELINQLHYYCHQCSSLMNEPAWACSAECLEEDLRKRKECSLIAKKIKAPKY